MDPVVDAESGLIYLRAGYYDPATEQFLSRDPRVALTQSPYGYGGDNPLNGSDPTGLVTVGVCGGANLEVLGFLNAGADGCLAQTLNGAQIGLIGTVFGPGGVGDGAALFIFGGGYIQVTNATNLGQLRGKFMYASLTLDAEGGVQGVAFWNQSFTVVGFELGIGAGGGASLAGGFSDTGVHTLGGIPAMLAHAVLNATLPPLLISSLLQKAEQFAACQ